MPLIKMANQSFLNHCRYEKHLSLKTIKAYSIDLQQFRVYIEDRSIMEVEKITKYELREFLESITHLKPKTIKRKIATLKALFNFLEFDDQISINPWRKMKMRIKEAKTLPTVLELSEIGDILKLLYNKKMAIEDPSSYTYKELVRNILVLELLFATGGRVSEIAYLKTEQIDLSTGAIIIQGKGNKERIIQICNRQVLSILKLYKKAWNIDSKPSGGYFLLNRFGNVLSDQSVRNLVRKVSKEAGISKHVTPHVFRHSFATLLLEKDVDIKYIQSLLGHSSINTTQIYTHVSKIKQRQLLKSKHPRKNIFIRSI